MDGGRLVLAGQQGRVQDGRDTGRKSGQVRAHVGRGVHAHGEELAVLVERQFRLGHVIAAVRVRKEGFRAVRRPFDRAIDLFARPHQRGLFAVQVNLGAESAAHVRRNHAHLVLRQAQHESGHQQPLDMRVLVGDVQRIAVVGARVLRIGRARLDGVGNEAVVVDVQCGHVVRLGECRVHRRLVAQGPHIADVVRRDVVHGGFGLVRSAGIGHRRQDVVADFDGLRRILGLLDRIGHHQRHAVPHVTHLAQREHRVRRLLHWLAVHVSDEPAARQAAHFSFHILAGKDLDHAGHPRSTRRVDGFDRRMGVRRTQEHCIALPRQHHVVSVLTRTGQEARIFLAFQSLSNGSHVGLLLHRRQTGLHRFDDVVIPGAAAHVSIECRADLILAEVLAL